MSALSIGKDELEKAQDSPMNPENIALTHAMLAIGYLLVALVERANQVIEPDYQNKDGSLTSSIRVTFNAGG